MSSDRPTARQSMTLACDVGNSRVKLGLFHRGPSDESGPRLPVCLRSALFRREEPLDWALLREWTGDAGEREVRGVMAATNPDRAAQIHEAWSAEIPGVAVRFVRELADGPLPVLVDEPRRVGIDRLLNAVAADLVRPRDRGAIIVDSGTATTVDVVDVRGRFRGGAILPGFELAAWSLHRYTALLPEIGIEQLAAEPHPPLGTDTRRAIRSGLFWGQLGAVNELIRRLTAREEPAARELFGAQAPLLLLTGGGAELLSLHFPTARHEPHLSMQGLVLATEGGGEAMRMSKSE